MTTCEGGPGTGSPRTEWPSPPGEGAMRGGETSKGYKKEIKETDFYKYNIHELDDVLGAYQTSPWLQ